MKFKDRPDAGRLLATRLRRYAGRTDVIVLGLPRGGIPVAFEVARALRAPLDAFVVRKLGAPGQVELAMGAIAAGGVRAMNEDVIRDLAIPPEVVEATAAVEAREVERREALYRPGRPPIDAAGRIAILVDDGLATGATMRAAARALRRLSPARIVVAVPIASPESCAALRGEADEVICALTPEPFYAVGLWYHDFSQTPDEEVRTLLDRARGTPEAAA